MNKKTDKKTDAEIEGLLLSVSAVALSPQKPFVYTSGNVGPIYCDNRLLLGHPDARNKVVSAFLRVIEEEKIVFDVIAGTATAGIPWAAFLADRLQKPMVYVRGAQKSHGKQNSIEGSLDRGLHVLLVEDTINFGGSSIAAVETLRNAEAVVEHCLAIYSHEHASAHTLFEKIHCKLHVLSGFSCLVRLAEQKKMITLEEKKILERWHNDPLRWKPDA